jgi:hypothetical protein
MDRWSGRFQLVHGELGEGPVTILSNSARPRCSASSQLPSPRRIKRLYGQKGVVRLSYGQVVTMPLSSTTTQGMPRAPDMWAWCC